MDQEMQIFYLSALSNLLRASFTYTEENINCFTRRKPYNKEYKTRYIKKYFLNNGIEVQVCFIGTCDIEVKCVLN